MTILSDQYEVTGNITVYFNDTKLHKALKKGQQELNEWIKSRITYELKTSPNQIQIEMIGFCIEHQQTQPCSFCILNQ